LINLYRKAENIKGIKKIFIGSGIRYDLFTGKTHQEAKENAYELYAKELVINHVSGRLKVAPEHSSDNVLKIMRKPSMKLFYEFKSKFERISREAGLNQQIIPYFMALLALETKKLGFKPEQVQDFTPTPMTLATEIYYSGYHPYTLEKIYVAKTDEQKKAQNRFFFWYKAENHKWILNTLKSITKEDIAIKLLPQSKFQKQYFPKNNFNKRPKFPI
jgi:radical SAM superfamily enzyme YgiQ (UPF0313 family)